MLQRGRIFFTHHLCDTKRMLEVMEGNLIVVKVNNREEVPEYFYLYVESLCQSEVFVPVELL